MMARAALVSPQSSASVWLSGRSAHDVSLVETHVCHEDSSSRTTSIQTWIPGA